MVGTVYKLLSSTSWLDSLETDPKHFSTFVTVTSSSPYFGTQKVGPIVS